MLRFEVLLDISKAYDKIGHKGLFPTNTPRGFHVMWNPRGVFVFKLLKKKRCFKWTIFFMGQYWSRCTSSINTWTTILDMSLFYIFHNMNTPTINSSNDLNKSETGQFNGKWILTPILVNKLRRQIKRQIIIQFILITALFNKFPLKNILECILILNWVFRNT